MDISNIKLTYVLHVLNLGFLGDWISWCLMHCIIYKENIILNPFMSIVGVKGTSFGYQQF
jgi:hypothetical protein